MNHQFVIEEPPANPALTRIFERARRNYDPPHSWGGIKNAKGVP